MNMNDTINPIRSNIKPIKNGNFILIPTKKGTSELIMSGIENPKDFASDFASRYDTLLILPSLSVDKP